MSGISFNVSHRNDNLISSGKSENTTSVSLLGTHTNIYDAIQTGKVEGDGVSLTISDNARKELEEKYDQFLKMQEQANKIWAAKVDEQAGKSQAEAIDEEMKSQSKAMETARRIAKGGRVPIKDEQKLMEYSSQMYQMAKQAAMFAKEHKKYKKSLYENEEEPESFDEEIENEKYDVVMEVPNEMIESGEAVVDNGDN